MTTAERDWHKVQAEQLRGDVVNLFVAAAVATKHGDSRLCGVLTDFAHDLRARAMSHEERAREGTG
jgi:hypothetical protein